MDRWILRSAHRPEAMVALTMSDRNAAPRNASCLAASSVLCAASLDSALWLCHWATTGVAVSFVRTCHFGRPRGGAGGVWRGAWDINCSNGEVHKSHNTTGRQHT